MLGWEIFVFRGTGAGRDQLVARWRTGSAGLAWLMQLVKEDKASDLGGYGYPCKFAAPASVVLPLIVAGAPANDGPPVIGDDYVLPGGWNGEIVWNRDLVLACEPDDMLNIEAWDQS